VAPQKHAVTTPALLMGVDRIKLALDNPVLGTCECDDEHFGSLSAGQTFTS
jgi:hypothetical protein